MRRRQRRCARGNSRLPYGTRRDPVLFERVDLNNPALPPTSHQRDNIKNKEFHRGFGGMLAEDR
ncbi:hypothetical protein L914_21585 [Phytophthora nicotianae]|uniref:Uncharacterized protein n=1 Tax=Phytophthora nicotianae TaxID=4792 RepID=W2M355_PHYNI|nr:hypothetical protein L914_21585 [Phytophthora nicotianae]